MKTWKAEEKADLSCLSGVVAMWMLGKSSLGRGRRRGGPWEPKGKWSVLHGWHEIWAGEGHDLLRCLWGPLPCSSPPVPSSCPALMFSPLQAPNPHTLTS